MSKKILLNNKKFILALDDLPMLIHGSEHEGSSLFTVTVLANLYNQIPKILFLSGYQMAREELIKQIGGQESVLLADNTFSTEKLVNTNVIIVPRENTDYFSELATSLPDINERLILIKNIDLFDEKVFRPVMNLKRLILSGNLDKCSFNKHILKTRFKTKVFFSGTNLLPFDTFPNLNEYEGYLTSEKVDGIVKINE